MFFELTRVLPEGERPCTINSEFVKWAQAGKNDEELPNSRAQTVLMVEEEEDIWVVEPYSSVKQLLHQSNGGT